MRNKNVDEGSTAKLTCYVRGQEPVCTWLKNGNPLDISNKSKYRCDITDGIVTLEVFNVTVEDDGQYECQLRNAINEISTKCFLNVSKSYTGRADGSSPIFAPIEGIFR